MIYRYDLPTLDNYEVKNNTPEDRIRRMIVKQSLGTVAFETDSLLLNQVIS